MHPLARTSVGEHRVTPARDCLLEVSELSVRYRTRRRGHEVAAVDQVSLDVGANETVGLVGESGSGKTTLSRAVLGLTPPSGGAVRFEGDDITRASRARRRELSRHLQVVFQDPYGSLSPTRTIGQTLAEPLIAHRLATSRQARDQVAVMLQRVGLPPDAMNRFPSEFSGGQRQRVAIARALMPSPRLVICDEPVSALDLSVQAQVLNLLRGLQREYQLSYLFIAHNLAVVRHMSHRIVVLYRGQVMEQGPASAVYTAPGHPYTRTLLAAEPQADPELQAARRAAAAAVPPVAAVPAGPAGTGCPFAARCPFVIPDCRTARPPLVRSPGGTEVACIRAAEIPAGTQSTVKK
ncbi:MAG: oligopeptide/dipeptide ABC transporter ATP-binding protein [Trebonia sp.]|jgi:peptide/nickel transport system ATP-binding protein